MFPPEACIGRVPEVSAAELDGELVLLNSATGKYYILTRTAISIWGLLENPMTVSALCEELRRRYAVEVDRCRTEVLRFLGHLQEERLVTLNGPA